jgi:hypothetical protein
MRSAPRRAAPWGRGSATAVSVLSIE